MILIPQIDDRVLLVTGAAGGIGSATARRWVGSGGRAVLIDVHQEALLGLGEELGSRAAPIVADVRDEAQVAGAVERGVSQFGQLDAVFNNAAILGPGGGLDALTLGDWEAVLGTTLTASFLVTKHAIPHLKERGGGAVIMTASISALHGSSSHPAYAAAKGGLLALSASLARQLGRYKIRVNAIAPGSVAGTGLVEASRGYAPTAAEMLGIIGKVPLGQLASVEDIANLVTFLASDEARHINGAVIRVDGGELSGW